MVLSSWPVVTMPVAVIIPRNLHSPFPGPLQSSTVTAGCCLWEALGEGTAARVGCATGFRGADLEDCSVVLLVCCAGLERGGGLRL